MTDQPRPLSGVRIVDSHIGDRVTIFNHCVITNAMGPSIKGMTSPAAREMIQSFIGVSSSVDCCWLCGVIDPTLELRHAHLESGTPLDETCFDGRGRG